MFLPACSFSRAISAMSPRIRDESLSQRRPKVVNATILGMAFIRAAFGSLVFQANEAAKVWW